MKKVRGFKRYLNNIKSTIDKDSTLDLDFLRSGKYFNFQFEDWYGSNIGLKKLGKRFVIEQTLLIYEKWERELKEKKLNHQVVIWLHDPLVALIEIVCFTDDKSDYYSNEVFSESKKTGDFGKFRFPSVGNKLDDFSWKRRTLYEPLFQFESDSLEQNAEYQRAYLKQQNRLRKKNKGSFPVNGNPEEVVYLNEVGDVWIGSKN